MEILGSFKAWQGNQDVVTWIANLDIIASPAEAAKLFDGPSTGGSSGR